MKKLINKQSAVDIAVILVLAAVIALSAFLWFRPGMKGVAPAINPFLILRPQDVQETVIADYAGVQRVYEFDLTEASGVRGGTLFVHLRHTIAVAEKDGMILADTGEANSWHIGRTPGNYWLSIPIYPEDAGKTLRITLTPVYPSFRSLEPEFLVMDRQTLLHMEVLPDEALMLTLGSVTAIMGFVLMLLALFVGLRPGNRRRIFYLGAVACTAGLWKVCGLSSLPLLFDWYGRQKLLWYIGAAAYLMMLVLSLRLLTLMRKGENDRVGKLCCYFGAFSTLMILALQVFGVVELHEVLVPYGIGMAGLHLISLLGQKPERSALLWLIPSFAALAVDLALFSGGGSFPTAPVFLIWIALNLLVRGFVFLRVAIRREQELREKDYELRGAKIQNLISQIRPHFIYNTLASVSMLCESDPQRASEVVGNFNNYLQSNFNALSATEPIAFLSELEHTKAYLNVQKALYDSKLSVEYDTDYITFRLPPLTLQPIVENSVKHGIGKTHRAEKIFICSRAVEGGAEIIVEDDGTKYEPAPDGKVHIGLENIRERLQMMCGGTLSVAPRASGGTVVTVFVPKNN
ncbi:MAG: histidine kinase [Oscillospiraceae bacterium]|nr:histidine kinase [Oscillospiraceae bacterium]